MAARQLDEGLWVCDRPQRIAGMHVGARMTVIRLSDGGLFVHSPVAPDAATRAEVDVLGPVRHVVAPNRHHHLYVAAWRDAYPGARFYAAPGLPEKRSRLHFDEVLGDAAPAAWAGQIEQLVFGGIPFVSEVVFFHPASRTLLLTDLAFNRIEPVNLMTSLWTRFSRTRGRFASARYLHWMVRDREAARRSRDRMLAWDFDRVTVTHGIVLQEKGHRVVRAAFDWLSDPQS